MNGLVLATSAKNCDKLAAPLSTEGFKKKFTGTQAKYESRDAQGSIPPVPINRVQRLIDSSCRIFPLSDRLNR